MAKKKPISEHQVLELAKIHCNFTEMGAVLDCDPKTLKNRFSDIIEKGKEIGKMSLRRAMFHSAIDKGNITMQIWLSKQYLGFTEKVVQHTTSLSSVEVRAIEKENVVDLKTIVGRFEDEAKQIDTAFEGKLLDASKKE